jgi:predicted CXXCH cytochrome family protein
MDGSMTDNGGQLRWLRGGSAMVALGVSSLALSSSAVLSCTNGALIPARARSSSHTSNAGETRVHSNIERADYAGSARCEACHGEIYRAWEHSPMHRMTRQVETTDVRAPFDGAVFHLAGDTARVERQGGGDFVELESAEGKRLYRVTRVIGGRYREDFVGTDVTGVRDPLHHPGHGAERVLPISYVFSTASWRYKGYSVMLPERPALRAGPVWSATCIGCHNTLPYLDLMYDDLFGPGAPKYQGSVADHLAQTPRSWAPLVKDEQGLETAILVEVAALGDTAKARAPRGSSKTELKATLKTAIETTRHRLDGEHLVELGVGCEACHGGSAEHANDPRLEPSFEVESPYLELRAPSGTPLRAEAINHACSRCHTVLFSHYPWTWEGGRRASDAPGGSSTNSGEARDFLLGGCSSQMSCTSCHDPHAEDRPEKLAELATTAGNGLCLGCHEKFAGEPALLAHTHHPSGSDGSACVACHMPRKNMGLDYRLTRYHRIGSPTDEERVLGDRPLECALCHADRSVEQLTSNMERWWGKSYDRAALRALYGPTLERNVIDATLERGKPHEQAVAIAVLGDQKRPEALRQLVPELAHDYPLVRYYAKAAIERVTGEPLPLDVNAPVEQIRADGARWLGTR